MTPDHEDLLIRAATVAPDATAEQIDRAIHEVLRLVREHLAMDVAFVSRLHARRRYFATVDTRDGAEVIAEGTSDPSGKSLCQRVIDGRLPHSVDDLRAHPDFEDLPPTPFPVGAHLSVPVVLADGSIYGTFCCFSFAPQALVPRDLKRLRMAADMAGRLIDQRRRG